MSEPNPRPLVWALHALNATVIAIVGGRALMAWDKLPGRVPMHFNYEGQADRWADKDAGFAVLFAIPIFLVALLYGMRAAMGYFARRPELANLPPRLRELPADRLAPLFEAVRDALLLACTAVNLALGSALWGTLQVALGQEQAMPGWTAPRTWLPVIIASLVFGLGRLVVVSRRLGGAGA
jgi:hypothetical protein